MVAFNNTDDVIRIANLVLGRASSSVLVVDNSTNRDDARALADACDRMAEVVYVRPGVNIGFGAAVNFGVARCQGGPDDILWILNPDTDFDLRVVDSLISLVDASGFGVISPRIVTGKANTDWFAGAKHDARRGIIVDQRRRPQSDDVEVVQTEFMCGAAPLMTLATWHRVGGFRDDFFMYWEDAEWSQRAADAGIRMGVSLSHTIWHRVGGASESHGGKSGLYYFYMMRNRIKLHTELSGIRGTFSLPFIATSIRWLLRCARANRFDTAKLMALARGVVAGYIWALADRVCKSKLRVELDDEFDSPVLILWADSRSPNLGVRVLARGTAELIGGVLPKAKVEAQDFSGGALGVNLGPRTLAKDILSGGRLLRRRLRKYELIIDTGAGDSFTDIYGLRRPFIMWYVHRVCVAMGKPVILSPQTIGPFGSPVSRIIARNRISTSDLVIARESVSYHVAAGLSSRTAKVVGTDVVFSLPMPLPLARTEVHDVLLNVSGLLVNGDNHVDGAAHIQVLETIVSGLKARGRRVELFAHVLDSGKSDNDVSAIEKVQRSSTLLGDCEKVIPADLEEARGHIASSKLVVGARMHACLNSLSVGVPAIGMAYSRKFHPLFTSLEWPCLVDARLAPALVAESALDYVDRIANGEFDFRLSAARERGCDGLSSAQASVARLSEVRHRSANDQR
ncbi:polysaccharide pyruvyl transferase family protein [Gordonia sp. CNJ-863]|uniref:polysaccharide pyruvyl transferase family protein n=1 Tax=Gordonia sp. CNJ-863 TaxID=1904963 RepID=UPI00096AC475|nr:polysaccharide pyruvyl transferase family protein [Gordonia sp. CNJ-863]